jgi:hypothetical protein
MNVSVFSAVESSWLPYREVICCVLRNRACKLLRTNIWGTIVASFCVSVLQHNNVHFIITSFEGSLWMCRELQPTLQMSWSDIFKTCCPIWPLCYKPLGFFIRGACDVRKIFRRRACIFLILFLKNARVCKQIYFCTSISKKVPILLIVWTHCFDIFCFKLYNDHNLK